MTGNKLIIVSNRLPFRIEKKDGKLELRKSTGGLVSAMESAVAAAESVVWVGAADFKEDIWNEYKLSGSLPRITIVPVFIDKKVEKKYYHGFSNSILWPLFHYFPSYAVYREDYYEAYKEVNAMFAEEVEKVSVPGDTVWVHDYHLLLLPGLLKQSRPSVAIGFFLHIPFPSYEILKLIPEKWRNTILSSLLKADVVGFHTKEYVSHFQRSLSFFLAVETGNQSTTFEKNTTLIKDYPISIDFKKFNSAYDENAVAKGREQIRKRHRDVKIIFSVDRLDYTKGVLNRLQAFEELLNTNTEFRQQVTFIINVVPSRDNHIKYAERRRLIEEQISHINGLYGNVQWTPIIYQYGHLTFHQLISFYTSCDVALITPMRDGMNLVAKEFVASRKDLKGVLVLSEFAGAANELGSAIMVNPNDLSMMKDALSHALQLSPEAQKASLKKMQATLRENDIKKWTTDFLNDLNINKNQNSRQKVRVIDFDERLDLLEAYKSARERLILLDYDGTLVPYFDEPQDARPDKRITSLLDQLASDPRNHVVIISGRDTRTLENWFKAPNLGLVAEHGAYYKDTNAGNWSIADLDSESWKPGAIEIFQKYCNDTPGSFIEEKSHAVSWHYRKAKLENEEQTVQKVCRELVVHNATGKFNVLCGKKIIEAKNAKIDKGTFVTGLLANRNFDFVLAFGDDVTDEDMFRILTGPNQYSLKVGLQKTLAMYNVIGLSNVYSFLEQLINIKSPIVLSRN